MARVRREERRSRAPMVQVGQEEEEEDWSRAEDREVPRWHTQQGKVGLSEITHLFHS